MPQRSGAGAEKRSGRRGSAWSVRRKLAAVLALPVLLALVLGGVRVQAALATAADATATAGQVGVLGPAVEFLTAAEDAAVAHQGNADEESGRGKQLLAVDQAASELRQVAGASALTEQQRAAVEELLTGTDAVRDGSGYRTASEAVASLETLGDSVSELVAALAATGSAAQDDIALVGQAAEGRLAATVQHLHALETGGQGSVDGIAAQVGAEAAALSALQRALPGDDRVVRLVELSDGAGDKADVTGLYDDLTGSLVSGVDSALTDAIEGSRTEATVIAALVLVVLLVAAVLALLAARSVTRPIRRVREGVLAVTHEHLPRDVAAVRAGRPTGDLHTIDVVTDDDTGRLARAVDDLHHTAVRLAEEDAELRARVTGMVAALNDRNASLVDEQLQLIEGLEHDEEDPQRLENLFLLDHLASRMRRTGDSLAVLADARQDRTGEEPLSMTDVLHAATAGVRDYRRVTVAPAPSTRITGSAAADVVHLVGELLDNALTFSPDSSEVRVLTSTPGGMVLVEVHDAGPGIDPQRMTELNRELRAGGQLTTAPTRDGLGLLVVSRLARRHGITVLLEDNVDGGVTAQVFLPRPLLTNAVPDSGPVAVPTPSEEREPEQVVAPEPVAVETAEELEPAAELEPVEQDEDDEVDVVALEHTDVELDEPAVEPEHVAWGAPVAETGTVIEAEPVVAEPAAASHDPLAALFAANIGTPAREPRIRPGNAPAPVWEAPAVARSEETDRAEETDEPLVRVAGLETDEVEVAPHVADEEVEVDEVEPVLVADAADVPVHEDTEAAEDLAEDLAADRAADVEDEDAPTAPVLSLFRVRPDAAPEAEVEDAEEEPDLEEGVALHQDEAPADDVARTDEHDEVVAEQETEPDEGEVVAASDQDDEVVAGSDETDELDEPDETDAESDEHAEVEDAEELEYVEETEDVEETDEPEAVADPAAALDDSLGVGDGPLDLEDDDDTPLFRMLRSSWFETPEDQAPAEGSWATDEAEAGWAAADRASSTGTEAAAGNTLPVRRPGAQLVPGGLTGLHGHGSHGTVRRDADAIRARLTAHASGVARGRAAAVEASEPEPTDPDTEE